MWRISRRENCLTAVDLLYFLINRLSFCGKIHMYLKRNDRMFNGDFKSSQFECIPLVLFFIETYIIMSNFPVVLFCHLIISVLSKSTIFLILFKDYSISPPSIMSTSLDVKVINSDDYSFQLYFKFELMFY